MPGTHSRSTYCPINCLAVNAWMVRFVKSWVQLSGFVFGCFVKVTSIVGRSCTRQMSWLLDTCFSTSPFCDKALSLPFWCARHGSVLSKKRLRSHVYECMFWAGLVSLGGRWEHMLRIGLQKCMYHVIFAPFSCPTIGTPFYTESGHFISHNAHCLTHASTPPKTTSQSTQMVHTHTPSWGDLIGLRMVF